MRRLKGLNSRQRRDQAWGILSPQERQACRGNRQALGRWAEDLAAAFLKDQGLQILGRNLRCGSSELDLLCQDGPEWAFVEVRCRRDNPFQSAQETLGPRKLALLIRGAQWYVAQRRWEGDWRIDLVAVDLQGDRWNLTWLQAVELEGGMDRGF